MTAEATTAEADVETQVVQGPPGSAAAPPGSEPRLRVLGFTDYFSEGSSGGAERVTKEVYRRLVAAGTEVAVLTATPLGEGGCREVDGIRVETVHSVDLSRLTGAQVSVAPTLARRALRLVETFRPHVLHANSLHFQTSIAAAICQRASGIPMVTTAHIGGSWALPPGLRTATGLYEHVVGRYILANSVRVIAVAPSVARHLGRLGVPSRRIEVIPNGVDLAHFAGGRPAAAEDVPLLLFVGRLIGNKGPQLLLDALALLHGWGVFARVVFVGEGPLRSDLQRRAARARLAGWVHFAGHCSDVAGWLARATVLVRPSLTEGMPLSVLEGMASGAMIVASDIEGNAELIRHGHNGLLFPAGHAGALARTLQLAIERPDLASALGDAARDSVRHYSWESCAAATLGVLRKAAAAPRPTAR